MPFQKCLTNKVATMMIGKWFFILTVASLTVFMSAKAQDKTVIGSEHVTQIETEHCSLTPELQLLLDLHNQTRNKGVKCAGGLQPPVSQMRWNCLLADAANAHVLDMFDEDFLSHTGSDNSTIGERATREGYIWRDIGENAAQGYGSAQDVYQSWLNSGAHCKSIMKSDYQDFGAAKAGDYWVTMFGRQMTTTED